MPDPGRSRRVLLVGRDYFFYTRDIASEMRRSFGAEVDFVPITPPGLLHRVLLKLLPSLARRQLERHHRAVLARLAARRFDVVLFIQVHQIGDLARQYRAAFPAARFILYYWDSLLTHDYLPYLDIFDSVFTFDAVDVSRHRQLKYLPLFYSERFRELRRAGRRRWDLSFVGIASSDGRYDRLAQFEQWAERSGLTFRKYLVVSPIFFLRSLLRGKWLHSIRFRSLSPDHVIEVYSSSNAIVDLPNNAQSGFTMRTFEALGAHRKLVTTNEAILNEEFYTKESVFVISRDGSEFPSLSFLRGDPVFSPTIEKYSLKGWISKLMSWDPPGEGA